MNGIADTNVQLMMIKTVSDPRKHRFTLQDCSRLMNNPKVQKLFPMNVKEATGITKRINVRN